METSSRQNFSDEYVRSQSEKYDRVKELLTAEELEAISYVELHYSGNEEHKLTNQDNLVKSAREKLEAAGIDPDDIGVQLKSA